MGAPNYVEWAIWSSLSKGGLLGFPFGIGNIFYVDPINGLDTNGGLTSATAFATTQHAVGLCAADHSDIIIHMPGGERPGDVGLNMNVRGITLIGVPFANPYQHESEFLVANHAGPGYLRDVALGAESASGPAVLITQACTIIGMEFLAAYTIAGTARYAGSMVIDGDGGSWNAGFCYIKQCRFPGWGLAGVGIQLIGTGFNRIEECIFDGLVEAGIMMEGRVNNCESNYITKNEFQGCPFGIDQDAGAAQSPNNTQVHENRFYRSDLAAMTNAIRTRNIWDSGFITRNCFGLPKATAIDQTKTDLETRHIYAACNCYTDGVDPRT